MYLIELHFFNVIDIKEHVVLNKNTISIKSYDSIKKTYNNVSDIRLFISSHALLISYGNK